jgi:hypothetical protein
MAVVFFFWDWAGIQIRATDDALLVRHLVALSILLVCFWVVFVAGFALSDRLFALTRVKSRVTSLGE